MTRRSSSTWMTTTSAVCFLLHSDTIFEEALQDICSVCQHAIQLTEPSKLTDCGHTFHQRCLSQWFSSRYPERLCPNCKVHVSIGASSKSLPSPVRVAAISMPKKESSRDKSKSSVRRESSTPLHQDQQKSSTSKPKKSRAPSRFKPESAAIDETPVTAQRVGQVGRASRLSKCRKRFTWTGGDRGIAERALVDAAVNVGLFQPIMHLHGRNL